MSANIGPNQKKIVVIPRAGRGIPGPPGPAGRGTELRSVEGIIQWKFVDEDQWRDIEGMHTAHTYLDLSHHDAPLPPPILKSANGTYYRLVVSDTGALSTVFVAYDPENAALSGTGYLSESGSRLISSTSYCFKGDPITTEAELDISALRTELDAVAGGVYKGLIVTGTDVVESIVAESPTVTSSLTGRITMDFPMTVRVPANQRIVVMTGRIDQGDGHVYTVDCYDGTRSGFSWQGIPAGTVGSSNGRIVEANPVVGTPINRGKGYNSAPFNVKIDWARV